MINRQTIEAHLSFLASDALEGRQAGERGGLVAAEYIKAILSQYGVKPFNGEYLQRFQACSQARERGDDFYVNPDSIARLKQLKAHRCLNLQNVIGVVEGELSNEYIVIGAHYDHLGVDNSLEGDKIYNGADDNASSVAALLQIAKAVVENGRKPLRSIILGFWDGEEVNYLGSEYFAASFGDTKPIKASINLDMISREGLLPELYPNFRIPQPTPGNTASANEFHLLYTSDISSVGQQASKQIIENKLGITPKPSVMDHRSAGSDYMAFASRGVPIIWFFTGLHPDYHTPYDEVDRVDINKLTEITKAVYLLTNHIANKR